MFYWYIFNAGIFRALQGMLHKSLKRGFSLALNKNKTAIKKTKTK